MKGLNSISIAQLWHSAEGTDCPGVGDDDVMILSSDKSTEWELFRYPCRVDAVVIAVCTQGEARATINLKQCDVSAGMIVVNLPENIIQIDRVSDDFQGHIILVSLDFLREARIDLSNAISVYMYLKDNPAHALAGEATGRLRAFFGLMLECAGEGRGKFGKEVLQGLVGAFLYQCSDELNNLPCDAERPPKSRREAFFRQFVELLAAHHKEQRSVGFYAERMHITPKYMSSLMKEITGRTAAEWIDEYVILEAKTLLRYSGLNIQEVAYELNFATQSFFGKYFKQHTGMSPGQYKMQ